MIEMLLIVVGLLILLNLVFTYQAGKKAIQEQPLLDAIEKGLLRLENSLRDEFTRNRDEMNRNAKDARGELTGAFHTFDVSVSARMAQISDMQKNQLDTFSQHLISLTKTNEEKLGKLTETVATKLDASQERMEASARINRDELTASLKSFEEKFKANVEDFNKVQRQKFDDLMNKQGELLQMTEQRLNAMRNVLEEKLRFVQEQMESGAKANRNELTKSLTDFKEQFKSSVKEFNELQKQKFDNLTTRQSELLQTTERRLNEMRNVIEGKLKSIQDDNNEKLEKMRQTVDEKLHKTLEERLGQSFQIVSDRLEQVQKGLGEMQTLANGVGDLKKVLNNVKTRGSLGEYRLEMILEQVLAPEQYQKNVATNPDRRENVEFAIKLPSKDTENETIWLPIDSKFPQDKYQALLDAYDKADPELVDAAIKELEKTIKGQAKDIRDKYINPPLTTDFAIMFLPFEGLYAEVVKRPELFETLQRDFKITIAGPSTIAAFLHSLQMGFRTLAIQKRSSEVWGVLGAVKTEFGKFGDLLDGVQKNLDTASKKISDASRKSRTIERKLKDVQVLPQQEAVAYLGNDSELDGEVEEETASQASV